MAMLNNQMVYPWKFKTPKIFRRPMHQARAVRFWPDIIYIMVTTLQEMEPVSVMHLFEHIYIVVSSSISVYLKLTYKPMVKGVHEWEVQSFLKVVS